jgi:hypothetical protein
MIHKWTLDLTDILSLLIHGLWASLTLLTSSTTHSPSLMQFTGLITHRF